jgi:phosphoglycolate phosphatase
MKTLLFDLDGTLTDPREGITRCIAHAMQKMGIAPLPLADLTFAIGPPLRPSLAKLIGTDERDAVEATLSAYRERFATIGLFENAVYDGIPETLSALQARGHTLYLATSKPRAYAERIVAHFGLAHYFSGIYGCELDGRLEHKDEIIGHIIERHKLEAARTIMIGDRSHDIAGARANGVKALGVTWGYGSREELEQAGAHALCATPQELLCLVNTL